MKNQNIIISISILFILAILGFMAYDFFSGKEDVVQTAYQDDLEKFEQIDTNLVKYTEIKQIVPAIEKTWAIATDLNNNIYITGNGDVQIFDCNGVSKKIFSIEKETFSIAVNEVGDIFLGARNHIEIWDTLGIQKAEWETSKNNALITSIAVDAENVFVADAANKIVYRYNLQGIFQNTIGEKDSLNGIRGFIVPSPYFDLALGHSGELWVANVGRHAFEAYTPQGKLISQWEKTSMQLDGFSGCCNPSNFALLTNGSYVTSEKGLVRIKIHKPNGEFECVVATPQQFERGTKGIDIAVDSENNIIVLDPKKNLIRIFQKNDEL